MGTGFRRASKETTRRCKASCRRGPFLTGLMGASTVLLGTNSSRSLKGALSSGMSTPRSSTSATYCPICCSIKASSPSGRFPLILGRQETISDSHGSRSQRFVSFSQKRIVRCRFFQRLVNLNHNFGRKTSNGVCRRRSSIKRASLDIPARALMCPPTRTKK